MAKKNKGGRPSTWTDPKVVEKLIDEYFKHAKKPTLSGLAVTLDISRSTLYEYEKKDQFSDIIKKARNRIIEIYEELLIHRDQNPTGVIFALKNMGWSDKQETELTGNLNIIIDKSLEKTK